MTEAPAAHEAGRNTSSADVGYGRVASWIGVIVALFLPIGLAAVMLANMISWEPRELALGTAAVLWAIGLIVAVAVFGKLLGLADRTYPGLRSLLGYAVGSLVVFAIVAGVRTVPGSDVGFEIDHALPQLYVPAALFLVATAEAGHHVSLVDAARAGWVYTTRFAWVVTAGLLVATLSSAPDAPGSISAAAAAIAYAAATTAIEVIRRRQGGRGASGYMIRTQ